MKKIALLGLVIFSTSVYADYPSRFGSADTQTNSNYVVPQPNQSQYPYSSNTQPQYQQNRTNYSTQRANAQNLDTSADFQGDNVTLTDSKMQNPVDQQDRKIGLAIRDALKPGWFSKGYDDISITVNNGNVTLQGSVPKQDDILKIENKVRKIDGVRNLNTQLTVLERTDRSSY